MFGRIKSRQRTSSLTVNSTERRFDRWVALAAAIALIALSIRLHRITDWSLGNDEVAEVRWASGSFGEMIDEVRRDAVHPPLDYVVQYALGKMGVPEWARRLPSALAGAATVFLVFLLGRRWFDPVAGLCGASLLTFATVHVRYSQEVRPYATAFFFIAFALVALEWFARTRRRPWMFAWAAAVWLAGATLYLAGVVAAAASLARILVGRRDELSLVWRRLPVVVIVWTLLYAPWLPTVFQAARYRPPQDAERLDWAWWQHRLQVYGTGDWRFEPVSAGSWAFWIAVAVGIGLSARHPKLRTATVWFVLGAVLVVVSLQLRPHYHTPRYLMPAWIGAFPLAGAGIAALLRRRATMMIGAALLGIVIAFDAVTVTTYFRGERPDWRSVARFVHERAQPGDRVVLANNWVVRNFGWYWQRLPAREGVAIERFVASQAVLEGPAWIVTGQCFPREVLKNGTELRSSFPLTELAEVRFVCRGCTLPMGEELCPE